MTADDRPIRPGPVICAPVLGLARETIYGGGAFDRANLRAMARAGCRVLVVLAMNLQCEPEPGWSIVRVPITRQFRLGGLITNFVFFVALAWLWFVRRERWDWLRMGDPYFAGPAVRLIAALTRRPILANVHHVDPVPRWKEHVRRWSLRAAACIWTPSAFSREQAIEAYGLDPGRTFFAHNAVPELAAPDAGAEQRIERLGLAGKEIVLFIGAMVPRKNLPVLIRAFSDVARARPKACLVIAGDAPRSEGFKAELARLAANLGLAERVRIVGRVDGATKAGLLRAASLMALPSRMEGFGLAAAEALSCGVPVVASDVGGLREVVRHNETGLLISPGDQEGLAKAIIELLNNDARRRSMGEAGRKDVDLRFSWDRQAEVILGRLESTAPRRRKVLGVMLNSGESVAKMEQEGQLGRFVNLYLSRYSRLADKVLVFSYGLDRDRFFENVEFVPGARTYGLVYGALMPILRRRRIRECTALRVMQMGGALPAVGSRLLWRVPYTATYGYRYTLFAKVKGRPVYSIIVRAIEALGLAFADRVIVTTRSLQEHVQRSKPADRVALLPNGVDLTMFKPKEDYALGGELARILYVGRLVPQKNLPLLVEAASRLKVGVELIFAGDGPERGAILESADKLGVRITLLGTIPHEQLPEIYRGADLFCLPSKIEGHPKSLIEAMAIGLPCVATRVMGTIDVIEHGVDGLLAEQDPDDMAEKLSSVVRNRALAADLGRSARAKVEREYDLNKILDREEDLLRELLGGGRG